MARQTNQQVVAELRAAADGVTGSHNACERLERAMDAVAERLCPQPAPKYRDTPSPPQDPRSAKYGARR